VPPVPGYVLMKIVKVKQNSKDWRIWRTKGLGASDVPAVMGESPWTTPFELWTQKTGLLERPVPNQYQLSAMKRGTDLEPTVRKMFESQVGLPYPAVSAEHEEYEFLRASFDGYNESNNTIVEIKCPNKVDHSKATEGQVPTKYISQVQQQLAISKAKLCYYVSWDGKSPSLAVVEVLPDLEMQKRITEACVDFWKRVQHKILPDVRKEDVHKLVSLLHKYTLEACKISETLTLITEETKND
jgi:putative phage-type endonuclease